MIAEGLSTMWIKTNEHPSLAANGGSDQLHVVLAKIKPYGYFLYTGMLRSAGMLSYGCICMASVF